MRAKCLDSSFAETFTTVDLEAAFPGVLQAGTVAWALREACMARRGRGRGTTEAAGETHRESVYLHGERGRCASPLPSVYSSGLSLRSGRRRKERLLGPAKVEVLPSVPSSDFAIHSRIVHAGQDLGV